MSTYYTVVCRDCKKNSGFVLASKMWGWGNFDIIKSFKFIACHIDSCSVEAVGFAREQTEEFDNWEEDKESIKSPHYPYSDDWAFVQTFSTRTIDELQTIWIKLNTQEEE